MELQVYHLLIIEQKTSMEPNEDICKRKNPTAMHQQTAYLCSLRLIALTGDVLMWQCWSNYICMDPAYLYEG